MTTTLNMAAIRLSCLPALRHGATRLLGMFALSLSLGCAPALPLQTNVLKPPIVKDLPDGFFIPVGYFEKAANETRSGTSVNAVAKQEIERNLPASHTPPVMAVALYDSPTTRNYFAKGGLDAKPRIQAWEVFLRKYKISYEIVSSPDQLEKMTPGVLVLPSSVALSDREQRAVVNFRNRGGGVLASWLTGVRDEQGEWRGFAFMESALDVKVVGTNETDLGDTFMMPHGDNPVTHYLPSGFRIWLERIRHWQPLRLTGAHSAAHLMDWSRTFNPDKPGAAIVFDERSQTSGRLSRSVVFGYPERLWISADPKLLEAITHDSLMWLLRQPAAYAAAWPYPHASAFVMTVDIPGGITDTDLKLARLFKDSGAPATYYVLSANAVKSAAGLRQLQAMGHEIAFLGDRFDDFKNQSPAVQAKRFDSMRKETSDAGIVVGTDAGFSPPMESFDKTTRDLLRQRAFGHFMASMDSSEARLPFIDPGDVNAAKPLVVLPRTHRGIEPVLSEHYAEQGLGIFLDELDLSEKMAGLSIIKVSPETFVTPEEWTRLFAQLNGRRGRVWLATAGQVAESWRQQARVTVRLEAGDPAPLLHVTIKGAMPLSQAVAVWVNLPVSNSSLRLTSRDGFTRSPKIGQIDAWRAAVVLDGLAPGEYRWNLHFDQR